MARASVAEGGEERRMGWGAGVRGARARIRANSYYTLTYEGDTASCLHFVSRARAHEGRILEKDSRNASF